MSKTGKGLNGMQLISLAGFAACLVLGVWMWRKGLFTSQEQLDLFMGGMGHWAAEAFVLFQAVQVVVPVLAVGLCYEVESDVLRMLVYYILSLMSVNSPADSVLRAAFCHYPENYITLMEYYDPAEHGMEAYTRK